MNRPYERTGFEEDSPSHLLVLVIESAIVSQDNPTTEPELKHAFLGSPPTNASIAVIIKKGESF